MDKRWRNLGILVLVVVVIALAFFLYNSFSVGSFDKVIQRNGYTTVKFESEVSSLSTQISPGVLSDLKELSKTAKGSDKNFLEGVIQLESNKQIFLLDFNQFMDSNLESACDNIIQYQSDLGDAVVDLSAQVEYLDSVGNSYGVDLNTDYANKQAQLLPEALNELEYSCIDNYISSNDVED